VRGDALPCPALPRVTLSADGALRLANVTRSDAGSYSCFARNRFGMASTTGRLLVTGTFCRYAAPGGGSV
jgi:hypothetical protein